MAEKGGENIYADNNTADPGETESDNNRHTASTTLTEEVLHAPSHFDILPANEEFLPVATEASDRDSRLTHPDDKGDWDLPTKPIQPVSFKIFFLGIVRLYVQH